MLAVSGIDHTVKIFSADSRERHNAAKGIGIGKVDSSSFSSIGRRDRRRANAENLQSEAAAKGGSSSSQDEDSDDDTAVKGRGLRSMKRLEEINSITRKNDTDRKRGTSQYISRSLLTLMLARYNEHNRGDAADPDADDDEDPNEQCDIM